MFFLNHFSFLKIRTFYVKVRQRIGELLSHNKFLKPVLKNPSNLCIVSDFLVVPDVGNVAAAAAVAAVAAVANAAVAAADVRLHDLLLLLLPP